MKKKLIVFVSILSILLTGCGNSSSSTDGSSVKEAVESTMDESIIDTTDASGDEYVAEIGETEEISEPIEEEDPFEDLEFEDEEVIEDEDMVEDSSSTKSNSSKDSSSKNSTAAITNDNTTKTAANITNDDTSTDNGVSLSTPTISDYDATADSITLNWKKVSNAKSYKIYVHINSAWRCLKTVSGTSYTIKGVTSGTTYQIKLRAVSGNIVSDFSSTAEITTKPDSIRVNSSNITTNSAKLSWNAVNCDGYRIQQYYNSKWNTINTVNKNTIAVSLTDLQDGCSYKYRVVAYANKAESASNTLTVVTKSVVTTKATTRVTTTTTVAEPATTTTKQTTAKPTTTKTTTTTTAKPTTTTKAPTTTTTAKPTTTTTAKPTTTTKVTTTTTAKPVTTTTVTTTTTPKHEHVWKDVYRTDTIKHPAEYRTYWMYCPSFYHGEHPEYCPYDPNRLTPSKDPDGWWQRRTSYDLLCWYYGSLEDVPDEYKVEWITKDTCTNYGISSSEWYNLTSYSGSYIATIDYWGNATKFNPEYDVLVGIKGTAESKAKKAYKQQFGVSFEAGSNDVGDCYMPMARVLVKDAWTEKVSVVDHQECTGCHDTRKV